MLYDLLKHFSVLQFQGPEVLSVDVESKTFAIWYSCVHRGKRFSPGLYYNFLSVGSGSGGFLRVEVNGLCVCCPTTCEAM